MAKQLAMSDGAPEESGAPVRVEVSETDGAALPPAVYLDADMLLALRLFREHAAAGTTEQIPHAPPQYPFVHVTALARLAQAGFLAVDEVNCNGVAIRDRYRLTDAGRSYLLPAEPAVPHLARDHQGRVPFIEHRVPAESITDFLDRYYKPDRYKGRGKEYAASLLRSYEEKYQRRGMCFISHHDTVLGVVAAYFGPLV